MEQNKRIQKQLYTCIYSQLTFGKGVKAIQWRKVSLLNKWCFVATGQPEAKTEPLPKPYTSYKKKKKLKMGHRAKYKMQSNKLSRRKHWEKYL